MLIKDSIHSSISSLLLAAFKKVHGNKYDYSEAKYLGAHTPIKIKCKKHEFFYQSPTAHKNGQGCPVCGIISTKLKKTLSQQSVIEAFRLKHGNHYDYSKVVYVKGHEKVTIICPIHDEFQQTPNAHKNGQGCPRCSGKGKTKSELIEEFMALHGKRYDYSRVVWLNSYTKIEIICPIHGSFFQTPNSHLQGKGCKVCAHDSRFVR